MLFWWCLYEAKVQRFFKTDFSNKSATYRAKRFLFLFFLVFIMRPLCAAISHLLWCKRPAVELTAKVRMKLRPRRELAILSAFWSRWVRSRVWRHNKFNAAASMKMRLCSNLSRMNQFTKSKRETFTWIELRSVGVSFSSFSTNCPWEHSPVLFDWSMRLRDGISTYSSSSFVSSNVNSRYCLTMSTAACRTFHFRNFRACLAPKLVHRFHQRASWLTVASRDQSNLSLCWKEPFSTASQHLIPSDIAAFFILRQKFGVTFALILSNSCLSKRLALMMKVTVRQIFSIDITFASSRRIGMDFMRHGFPMSISIRLHCA